MNQYYSPEERYATPPKRNRGHITRKGVIALMIVSAVGGGAAALEGEHQLHSMKKSDQRAYQIDHPSLLPANEVDVVTVPNKADGVTIASEFTHEGDRRQHLAVVIGHQGTGEDGSLQPGQLVLVPKPLEQFRPTDLPEVK